MQAPARLSALSSSSEIGRALHKSFPNLGRISISTEGFHDFWLPSLYRQGYADTLTSCFVTSAMQTLGELSCFAHQQPDMYEI